MLEKLELKSLAALDDGRVREAFEQALRRCILDCKDRPAVLDPRSVALVATMVPIISDDGQQLESCNVQFEIHDKIPKRKTKVYNMREKGSNLLFNELSKDDVRQGTLDEPELRAVVS